MDQTTNKRAKQASEWHALNSQEHTAQQQQCQRPRAPATASGGASGRCLTMGEVIENSIVASMRADSWWDARCGPANNASARAARARNARCALSGATRAGRLCVAPRLSHTYTHTHTQPQHSTTPHAAARRPARCSSCSRSSTAPSTSSSSRAAASRRRRVRRRRCAQALFSGMQWVCRAGFCLPPRCPRAQAYIEAQPSTHPHGHNLLPS